MSRTTSDTTYNVRTDVVETETGLTTEEGALYTYNGELKAHLGGSTVTVYPQSSGSSSTTTTINISSAQILAMGSTPIELLPAAGAGKYYEYSGFCELQYGTTPYTFADDALMFGGADSYAGTLVDNQFLSQTSNKYVKFGNTDSFRVGITGMTNNVVSSFGGMNEAIILTSYNGSNPTLGDGTLRVIITYTLRTFGA